jgi:hypothetical protein
MESKDKKPGKWIMIIFLIMIIVGFTIPGFLNIGNENQQYSEQRICKTDADCYLMCDDQPIEVLCSQNLCQQNSCTDKSYYAFNQTPKNIKLSFEIKNQKINLENRSLPSDLFVKVNGTQLKVFSTNLFFAQILEKLNIKMDSQCLYIDLDKYCQNNDNEQNYNPKLEMFVNGKESFSSGNYLPEDGDDIKVVYKEEK